MASALSRRIFFPVKNIIIRKNVFPEKFSGIRVSVAGCSTSGSSSNSITPPQDASKRSALESDPTAAGWDGSKVKDMLQEASLSDMPVVMSNPYEKKRVQCLLCQYNVHLDYKNIRLLSQFVSPYTGRLYGRNITRLCKKQQAELGRTISRSQAAGFMAVMMKSVEFLKDPKIFDPNNPIKPHNF